MVTKAMTTLVNAFMQPFKMFRDKLNTVIVVNLIVLNKTLLVSTPMPFSEIKQRGLP